MVVSYSSEKPNLSYVRINQNTSDGTGPSIKTYITKGLVSTDPFVVNASLLHSSLVAQPTVQTYVETPFWGNLELPNDSQDGPKDFSKSGGTVSVDNRSETTPAACAATSPGAAPKEVASARPESKQPLTSVRLPVGAILVKIDSLRHSSTNPTTNPPPTSPLVTNAGGGRTASVDNRSDTMPAACAATSPGAAPKEVASARLESKQPLISVCLPTGAILEKINSRSSPPATKGMKRKLDEVEQVNFPQSTKISTQSQKQNRSGLIQENQRLERANKNLVNENRELREKLYLLSKILKDPRKRDMLNARLARMQLLAEAPSHETSALQCPRTMIGHQ